MEPMLKVTDLAVSYGHVEALRGINVEVHKGQIVSIIGANGAGKTTLLRTISGLVKPRTGTVEFEGAPLPRKPSKIVGAGVVHVPEGRKCFSGLSIRDNLLVGGYLFKGADLEKDLQEQYKRFPILEKRKDQFAGTLSGGEQQMLAVARGLMSRPKILLLDEPSMGLAPIIVNQIYDLIREIRDSGITVLLVEQNARKALGICDYAYVLENGKINLSGSGEELLKSLTAFYESEGCKAYVADTAPEIENAHFYPFVSAEKNGVFVVENPKWAIPVATIQTGLDAFLAEHKDVKIDFIHGADVVVSLAEKPGNFGFILPDIAKNDLFRGVVFDGVLPRKTFSMGEAHEKRYYLEAKAIV